MLPLFPGQPPCGFVTLLVDQEVARSVLLASIVLRYFNQTRDHLVEIAVAHHRGTDQDGGTIIRWLNQDEGASAAHARQAVALIESDGVVRAMGGTKSDDDHQASDQLA